MKLLRQSIRVSIGLLIGLLLFARHPKKHTDNPKLLLPPVVIYARKPHVSSGDLRRFLRRMASIESGNDAHAVNRFGFLGKYQFHPHTIRSLGVRVTKTEFLNNPPLQDSVMVLYMRSNAQELHHVIRKWDGRTYNGVVVSKSGILAAAHLVGTTGVLAYFYPDRYHARTVDGNGTSVALYMKKFANYNLYF